MRTSGKVLTKKELIYFAEPTKGVESNGRPRFLILLRYSPKNLLLHQPKNR